MTGVTAPLLDVSCSLTGRRWQSRHDDERTALALAQQLAVPEIVGRVLAGRGVLPEMADRFLNPTLKEHLPDPSEFLDMDRAAERIARAIHDNERVAVFGDYDVDGATSSALLSRFFASLGRPLTIYIPDRRREGYGPNAPALLRLKEQGVALVITVDCGIMAHAALAEAADAGLDVVVVDHHQAEPQLPPARAVVNPNRLDETTAHRQLAAVGVAFLLVVAVNRALRDGGYYRDHDAPDLLQWLDLVALGTVCDVVPLTGLNRALVAQGLKILGRRANKGLAALADVAGLSERPGTYHLGFILGPRVNAGGRVGHSDLGARLLTTEDAAEAQALALELHGLNAERQQIEATVLAAATMQAERQGAGEQPLVLVANTDWHEGVIGIVASRLKDKYRRPAFVLSVGDGQAKGSGRSVPGVDLGAAVTAAKQAGLLLAGGGHAMAAGLTVAADRIDDLTQFLTQRIATQMDGIPQSHALNLDGAVDVGGATRGLYDTLQGAGPFGAGHPEPRLAIAAATVAKADIVGNDHVRLALTGRSGGRLKAIAFRTAGEPLGQALLQSGGSLLHLAGNLRADDWGGRHGVQLIVEDAAKP